MEPHVDNPYWNVPPTHLVIFVARPPIEGGQALLADGRAVLQELNATRQSLLWKLQEKGVRYEHYYPHDRDASGITSWQKAFSRNCTSGCNADEAIA